MRFQDRAQAGRALADRLAQIEWHDPVVLALPRGGVPVAVPVGLRLGAPVEVLVVRKVGLPGNEELGIGAVAEGLDEMVTGAIAGRLGLDPRLLGELAARERSELRRRVTAYRGGRPLPELAGRDVILIDDGLATGVTTEAATQAVRAAQPRRLVLAVPVCANESRLRLGGIADSVVCLSTPGDLGSVGRWYDDFEQVTDEEVVDLLAVARASRRLNELSPSGGGPSGGERPR